MFKSINGGKLPERATKFSAGFDVFANEEVIIQAGETKIIPLGICLRENPLEFVFGEAILNFYEQFYFELHPRSSIRAKGIMGGVGIIDIDYRDEIKMVIYNPSDRQLMWKVKHHEKIGQLIFKRHEGILLPDEYTLNAERNGGFGSTNEK